MAVNGDCTALLVIDAQKAVGNSAESKEVLSRIDTLIEEYRANGSLVVFIRYTPPALNGFIPPAINDFGMHHALLRPKAGEFVINKLSKSAFGKTQLDAVLRRRSIKELTVCGFYTDICVYDTVRDGAKASYEMNVVSDCCAGGTKMQHKRAIESLKNHEGVKVLELKDIVRDSAGHALKYPDGAMEVRTC